MGAAEIEAMMTRLIEARDPWQELAVWLGEQRTRNTAMGGDDLRFIHLIAFQTAMMNLPVMASTARQAEDALSLVELRRLRDQISREQASFMARNRKRDPGGTQQ